VNAQTNNIRSMDRRYLRYALLGVVALIVAAAAAAFFVERAGATAGNGVTPTIITQSALPEPIRVKFKDDGGFGAGTAVTNLTLVRYEVQPGGYFGWHQHGGPVWAQVAAGTLTLYEGDDASCTGTPYPAGTSFLDAGDHTHNARNEGETPVVVYATFMMPAGGALRIDVPDPGVCPF
jgi:quercetin dioxygenase-like cupin family protein